MNAGCTEQNPSPVHLRDTPQDPTPSPSLSRHPFQTCLHTHHVMQTRHTRHGEVRPRDGDFIRITRTCCRHTGLRAAGCGLRAASPGLPQAAPQFPCLGGEMLAALAASQLLLLPYHPAIHIIYIYIYIYIYITNMHVCMHKPQTIATNKNCMKYVVD
jgi:hypothetical protein